MRWSTARAGCRAPFIRGDAAALVTLLTAALTAAGCGGGAHPPTEPGPSVHRAASQALGRRISTPVGCFKAPGACGYPDPAYHNVGASNCAALPKLDPTHPPAGTYYSGSGTVLEVTAPHTTINSLNLGGFSVYISGVSHVTFNNVCINVDGGASEGSSGITIPAHVRGTTIANSTISGANATTQALGAPVTNQGTGTRISNVYTYNSGGGAPGAGAGTATVRNSYELVNAIPEGEHDEPIYFSDGTLTVDHSVLLNEEVQTAAVFGDTGAKGACDNHLTVTNSLIAGGDYVLYPCGNASSVGTSTMLVANNRFARCTTSVVFRIYFACRGGADAHGYFPRGGSYGWTDPKYTYCPPTPGQTWVHNVWDDNNGPVPCAEARPHRPRRRSPTRGAP